MMRRRMHSTPAGPVFALACASALGLSVAVSGCYTRLANLHPTTDITRVPADGDRVYLPEDSDPRDLQADFDQRAYGSYLEDRLIDPYIIGFTYSDRYGSGAGYGQYYEQPWWKEPRFGGGYSGGGSYGSRGSGAPLSDTTKTRVAGGRSLWITPTPPGAVQPGVSHDGPPASSAGSGSPSGGGTTTADSTKAQQQKKGAGRRLWR